jgi:phosphohistidine swiveling domain-containing protein
MNNLKLQKYIDYKAMYDVAVMEPYMVSFKKLNEYIGASEDKVLMLEEGLKDLPISDFNYQGRIITYHNPEQIEKVGKVLFDFLGDDSKWNSLIKKIAGYEVELESVMNIQSTKNILDKAKNEKLYNEIYSKYFDLYLEVITIYLITDGRYHEFSIKQIKQHDIDSETINKLTLPNKVSSFQIANTELSEVGKLFRANKDWKESFNKFLDKYVWFYLADTHYDFDKVVEDLKNKLSIESGEETTGTIKSEIKTNISDLDKKILSRISELGFQRMELRKYWQWIDYTIHTLLYNFAKENGLPEKTLVFLADSEIRDVLSGRNQSFDNILDLAQKRSQLFAAFLCDNKVSIFNDKNEIDALRQSHVVKEDLNTTLKGNVSYKENGEDKIFGTARVITWSQDVMKDLNQINDGEILVVTQTKPDFLPFLKKARAIVADEGGITSHVSIVTRELKIPAIVGTRTATDSIKTGDTIELNMVSGEIIINNK